MMPKATPEPAPESKGSRRARLILTITGAAILVAALLGSFNTFEGGVTEPEQTQIIWLAGAAMIALFMLAFGTNNPSEGDME